MKKQEIKSYKITTATSSSTLRKEDKMIQLSDINNEDKDETLTAFKILQQIHFNCNRNHVSKHKHSKGKDRINNESSDIKIEPNKH